MSSDVLGIDVGTTAVRVAFVRRTRRTAHLQAVAERPVGADHVAALRAAVSEVRASRPRCRFAVAPPDARLRAVRLPPMPVHERIRAATFEARRLADVPPEDAVVRVLPLAGGHCAVGIVRRTALRALESLAGSSGLRIDAVLDAPLALLLALPDADVVVDVGHRRTRVIAAAHPVPDVSVLELGSDAVTAAIATSLGIDRPAAERRKRAMGSGGAGDSVRSALVDEVARAVAAARARAARDPAAAVLTGAGARLRGLGEALSRATGLPFSMAELSADLSDTIPPDVLRAASPEWALACGAALGTDA